MTRSLALEWARNGIRVNAIAPGWVASPMTEPFLGGRAGEVMAQANPMRRLGTPEDLAGAVLLLASEAGRYITGTTIRVDGGQALG
jgi:NAD(P)-dependent dehydrogenase (short-subunit alcohol dehydrogenase family)